MRKNLQTTIFAILAMAILLSSKDVMAANNDTAPYGYTYEDSASGRTVYKYYEYGKTSYICTREFYSMQNRVCNKNGTVVTALSAGTGSRYNGFGLAGFFYSITSKGELISVDKNNNVTTLIPSGAISLVYTADDLADIVVTSSGNKYLETLKDAPVKDNPADDPAPAPVKPVKKAKNRVEIYQNSASEMVYDAYKDGKKFFSIVTSKNGKKVLNATKGVRLSDFAKGTKFMGIAPSYNVYMYEINNNETSLYCFKQNNWYSAEKIILSGAFKKFEKNENGFIEKVVTTKASYTIKQLTTSGKWKAKKTYAVDKGTYVTLYIKNSTKSHTLSISKGVLYLNGKAIAIGVSKKFGFISSKKFTYMKGGKVRTATIASPMKSKVFVSKARDFKKTSKGIINKVILTNGKVKKIS
jgi:hypothetical protein